MATQPREPLSPWAQRYGVLYDDESTLDERKIRHSGYYTGHPRMDPKFFAEPILQSELDGSRLFSHRNDIHRFFHLEDRNDGYFKGIKPWQYGPLMQYVRFSDRGLLPGGHWRPESQPYRQARHEELADIDKLLDDDMIIVNEDGWFPFLRRDRWYDLYGQARVPSGKTWSIDQPKLWDKIRVSVELVDRMLKALIDDEHPALHTMLFGPLMRWRDAGGMQLFPEPFPGAKVLLSYDVCKSYHDFEGLENPLDNLPPIAKGDWVFMLSGLLQNQTWGFTDDPDSSGVHWPGYDSVITLSVDGISSLSEGDITLAERCHLQYELARTFMDFDGVAELGYAVEQRVFGGITAKFETTGQHPFGMYHRSWPFFIEPDGDSTLGYKLGDHPMFSMTNNVVISSLPALYTSKILSQSFWEDANIPRKSDNFFHRNQLLVSQTDLIPHTEPHWEDITVDGGKLSRGEVEPVESWQHWESIWNQARHTWYDIARETWLKSPWGNVKISEAVYEFGKEFRLGNEIRCATISKRLVEIIPWRTDANTYRAALFPVSTDWIVHCIGLLMMAAIPIRRTRLQRTKIDICIMLQLQPSARAPTLPPIDIIPDCNRTLNICDSSELFDPIRSGDKPIAGFDHIDIFIVLRNAIRVVALTNTQVSKPWLFEILRVADKLEEQRTEMLKALTKADPAYHHGLWAPDWDFKIPDYNPNEFTIWDPAQNKWV
ncbi:hypothetical protein F4859DRAFT_525601 [Xylaria cf. heliscus]|nr:hypothetical protein F4859DRAFT_525601 [Xylaria cf. heliscus]